MLAARVSLPPKLKVTFVPGCSFSNSLPRVVKLSLSEAAAKTVTAPESFAEAEELEPAAAESESESEPAEEQAARASSAAAPAPAACRVRTVRRTERVITVSLPRSAWRRAQRTLPMRRSYFRICEV